ncbi:MAG: putative ABC exporter domain-containing protein [Oscillospiraceae bacterium]
MKAITYLFLTRFKNALRSLREDRAKLARVVVIVVILGLVIITNLNRAGGAQNYRPREELYAIILVFYALVFLLSSAKGLNNGASFYTMADVNLLFCSPVSPRRILIYGLVRQLQTAAIMAFALLFQFAWLSSAYGIGGLDMAAMILGYILTVFSSQLLAMSIYSFTSGDEKRRRAVVTVFAVLYALLALGILYPVLGSENMLSAAVSGANAKWTDFFPVAGWMRAAAVGLMEGDYLTLVLGIAGVIAFTALFIAVIFMIDTDYYEDVLVATEVSASAITAKKEGRLGEAVPKNVKLGRTGLGRGRGASAFYFKHIKEDRRGRVFLTDKANLIFMAISVVYAVAMRSGGIYPAFFFSTYMMVFGSFTSRWVRELQQPYVYMVPVSPFKKLVMICGNYIIKSVREAIVLMVIISLAIGAPAHVMLAAIAARCSFALIFIAASILDERVFGSVSGRTFQVILFFIVLLVLSVPGIIISFILLSRLGPAGVLGGITVWNAAVSALIAALCRDILVTAELNNR